LSPQDYILGINSLNFAEQALELFQYQYAENELYHNYCNALRRGPEQVRQLTDIPFLPISFFKSHNVLTGKWPNAPHLIFESSGTTGDTPSRHYIADTDLYEASLLTGFTRAFGPPEDYTFLALLPSYLERATSSLVHMARILMARSNKEENGFYLNEWEELNNKLVNLKAEGRKTILLGVTFALLDFAEAYDTDLKGMTVMETGGMKGRREEWTRDQVHDYLQQRWNLDAVATEYGMTELLSQAYSHKEGILTPSPTMQVLVRDITDPLSITTTGTGALNIIDLANVHSCAFIATEDIGTVYDTNSFEVLGRLDYAALRGCSLMTA
jgi:phenylacetate-coenzyme A ligase PaaK-like adenylate-forming protein